MLANTDLAQLSERVPSRTISLLNTKRLTFSQVYQEFRDPIYTFVLYRVGQNREVAEDVTSDIFLKSYKSFDDYNSQYAMSTWLYTIARNTLIDHYRKGKHTIDIEGLELADEVDSLYQLVTESFTMSEVEAAIEKLSDTQALIIREQYFAGKTAKEIAEELKMSHAAVRKQSSRALASLRVELLGLLVFIGQVGNLMI